MLSGLVLIFANVYFTNTLFINYTLRCPSYGLESVYRSSVICPNKIQYHCLYEDKFLLVEICQKNKQLPKGNYPRYSTLSDNIYYEECRDGTYQPRPVKSFEITDCLFGKSKCVSEGQIINLSGTSQNDTTCRCDYKNGYPMLHSEYCSPSFFGDCECYKKVCPLENQEMVPDYSCVNKCELGYERKEGNFECTVKSENSKNISSPIIPGNLKNISDVFTKYDRNFYIESTQRVIVYTYFALFGTLMLVANLFGPLIRYTIKRSPPILDSVVPVFVTLLIICYSVVSLHAEYTYTFKITFSVCLFLLLCFSVLLVLILATHEINQEHLDTENDEYMTEVLINAAASGNTGKLKFLHRMNVDMNLKNYDRRTALHLAVANGHLKTVKFLVKKARVQVLVQDRNDRYPVNETSNMDIKKLLNNGNKYANHVTQRLKSADYTLTDVMKAAAEGILHTLDNRNTNFTMDTADYSKQTPLHVAAANARLKDVEFLLNVEHVSPFVRNRYWKMPIDLVIEEIDLCEKHGLRNKTQSGEKKTRKEDLQKIKERLEEAMNIASYNLEPDKDFAKQNEDKKICLVFYKAYKGDIKAIRRYLLTEFSLLDKCNCDNRTLLHIAVDEKHYHLVEFILNQERYKSYSAMKDRWGETPLDRAKICGDEDMLTLFHKKLLESS